MYHIKPDKRSQNSAGEIVAGMLQCLKTLPLNAVTITDLHRITGVSRATFYRLFDTPEDVLQYHYDNLLAQAAQAADPKQTYTTQQLVEAILTLSMDHHEFLKLLVDNGRFDLLFRYTDHVFRIPVIAEQLCPPDCGAVEREYIFNQFSMAIVATIITWARNGRRETAAEVAQYLKRYIRTACAALDAEEKNTLAL